MHSIESSRLKKLSVTKNRYKNTIVLFLRVTISLRFRWPPPLIEGEIVNDCRRFSSITKDQRLGSPRPKNRTALSAIQSPLDRLLLHFSRTIRHLSGGGRSSGMKELHRYEWGCNINVLVDIVFIPACTQATKVG